MGSSVTVNDVRSLTANYQKMLEKATKGIKKLTIQNANLEREQDNLLTVNIDLATEAKRLVQEVKEGQIEKKGLLAANEEFVTEVKRLYREEEKWEEETSRLKAETVTICENYANEIQQFETDWEMEKNKFNLNQENLLESIRVLTTNNETLIHEKESLKQNSSKSSLKLKELH